ncbi:MAG: AAA family ATPase [Candidatus Micrarchaeaceae archaeon]|jgi:hypothetical protein
MSTTHNKAVVTHIYPKMSFVFGEKDAAGNFILEPKQKPISDERAGDVWYELRELTYEYEPGCILVATHEVELDADNAFLQTFEKDDHNPGRLLFPQRKKLTRRWKKEGKIQTKEEILPWSLGIRECAEEVIARYSPHRNSDVEPLLALVLCDPEEWCHLKYLDKVVKACPGLPIYIFHGYHVDKYGVDREGGRKEDYTFSTLPEDEEEDALEHLLAKVALTMMPAPSYTGKTHASISMGLSLVTGDAWLGHFKVPQKMRVRYFVPELSAGRFKKFMQRIAPPEVWKQHEEEFIVRPLDCDLLMLDSQEMIEKCRGCYVFLDTLGYFMGLDDNNSYAAAIEFAKRINHLIKEGCLGVCGLYHPPKYSKSKKETGNILTLENQILGSAGFGGLLRSCIALRNLNQDSNEGLWCYVQGLKNPGLGKPFQIKGFPMEYLGESPYLSELLGTTGTKKDRIKVMLSEGKTQKEICKELGVSPNTVTNCNKELKFDFDAEEESTPNE